MDSMDFKALQFLFVKKAIEKKIKVSIWQFIFYVLYKLEF